MEKSSGFSSFNFGPLFIFVAALLWTTDAFVRSSFANKLAAAQVVLMEHVIIVIAMSPLVIKYFPKLLELNKYEWIAVIIVGAGGSAFATIALTKGFFLGDYPYQYVVQVVFLQQMQPFIAIGLAHLLLKERLPSYYYILSFFAILGAFLLVFADNYVQLINGETFALNFSAFSNDIKSGVGLLAGALGLIAAVLWGASTVFGRYMLEHSNQKPNYQQMTTYRFTIALAFLLLYVPIFSEGYPNLSKLTKDYAWAGLLYMGLIVGLLSLILYYFGLKTTKASISTIFELAYPLSFYVIMPFLNTNARPNTVQKVGSVLLVVSATILMLLNNSQKAEKPQVESNYVAS